jgi:hypothetical protein
VIEHHIIPNNRGLSDNNAHPMINEKSSSNFCTRVNFDPRCPADPICMDSGKEFELMVPEKMSDSMAPERMDPWIGEDNFQPISRCWVLLHRCIDIL